MMKQRISVVGVGKLGKAILAGFARAGLSVSSYTRQDDQTQLGSHSDIIFLCMKPKDVEAYLMAQSHQFHEKHLLVSVCAGIGTLRLETALAPKKIPLAHVVMNTAVERSQGLCAFVSGSFLSSPQKLVLQSVLGLLGYCTEIQESQSAALMSLAACTPAFFYEVVDALKEASLQQGLEEKLSHELTIQVLKGVADMLEHSGKSAQALKLQVATTGGVTEQGLKILEDFRLREAMIKALEITTDRIRKI